MSVVSAGRVGAAARGSARGGGGGGGFWRHGPQERLPDPFSSSGGGGGGFTSYAPTATGCRVLWVLASGPRLERSGDHLLFSARPVSSVGCLTLAAAPWPARATPTTCQRLHVGGRRRGTSRRARRSRSAPTARARAPRAHRRPQVRTPSRRRTALLRRPRRSTSPRHRWSTTSPACSAHRRAAGVTGEGRLERPGEVLLGGDFGLDILAAGAPSLLEVPCGSRADRPLEQTVSTNKSVLTYDAAQRHLHLRVEDRRSRWGGDLSCDLASAADGSTQSVSFSFK